MGTNRGVIARSLGIAALALALVAPIGPVAADVALPTAAADDLADRPDTERELVSATPVWYTAGDWGTDNQKKAYDYPDGVVRNVSDTGAGDQGYLQAAAGKTASAYLTSVLPRDARVDAEAYFEWVFDAGRGIEFSTIARAGDAGHYAATVHLNPTTGEATLTIRRAGPDGATTDLASTTLPDGLVSVGTRFRLQFEVEGASPALRARVFPPTSAAPAWQLTTVDTAAERLTEAGHLGFTAYTHPDTFLANARVWNLRVTEDTTGAAQDSGIGAPSLGTGQYPVPEDPTTIVWVDPSAPETPDDWTDGAYPYDQTHRFGADTARGEVEVVGNGDPTVPLPENRTVRTLAAAIKHAQDGDTIIMRGGVYHEQLTISAHKAITIQPENGAVVWLDGSRVVESWQPQGPTWTSAFDKQFDNSPTFTWGAPDGAQAPAGADLDGWLFVDQGRAPMAAEPEQVFLDGSPLAQVSSVGEVTAGSFYFDRAKGRIHLGLDPAGHEVRVSDLQIAIASVSPYELRGIGIRRYASSVPHQSAVSVLGDPTTMTPQAGFRFSEVRLTDLIIQDNSVGGLSVIRANTTVTDTTTRYNGLSGTGGYGVSNLSFVGLSATHNNTERFNHSPNAAGIKVATVSGLVIRDGEYSHNDSTGLWLDVKVTDFQIVSNEARGNTRYGFQAEISQKGAFVNNVATANTYTGLFVQDSSNVQVWNNTLVGGRWGALLVLSQDRALVDGDRTETMQARNNSVHNNIIASPDADPLDEWNPCENTIACYYDTKNSVASSRVVTSANGNVYHRTSTQDPANLVRWAPRPRASTPYPTIQVFRAASGQEAAGWETTGRLPVTAKGAASKDLSAQVSAATGRGVAIDPTIAAMTSGRTALPSGGYVVGAKRP